LNLHQKYLCKVIIFYLLLNTPPLLATTLEYDGIYKNHKVNTIYTFKKDNSTNYIKSEITSNKISEINQTILKNGEFESLTQTTSNEIDGEYFYWEIYKEDGFFSVTFNNHKFNEVFTGRIYEEKPLTLQGIIYKIQNYDLKLNQTFFFKLITPWKTIIPIRFKIIEETTLQIGKYNIPSYFIKLELDLFFRSLLPKTSIWISKKKPHILIKQIDSKSKYTIKSSNTILNELDDESP